MAVIRTILGDIEPSALGATNSHDHLIRVGGGEVLVDDDHNLNSVDKAVEEATYFVKAGGGAVIDMCPIYMGRDMDKLLEVNRRVPDLNIVAATGFHKGSLYMEQTFHWISKYSVEEIAGLIVADIEEGIDRYDYAGPIVDRSTARAGVIKAATGYGMITDFEKKQLEACAIAAIRTGASINTHTTTGTMGLEQARMLIGFGVNPEKIAIGHIQRNNDPWYHKKITELGCYVEYDGTYRIKYLPDSSRIMLIREMCDAGYQDRILLGTDSGKRSYQKAWGSGTGIDYDLTITGPRMTEEGFDPSVFEDLMVNNPARFFQLDR
ncbi:MAG: phosphotriesterase-related protein [Acidimicrobiia bacterium]